MTYIIIAVITLLADLLSKAAAVKILMPVGSVDVIENVLSFTYVENKGIAFGMFAGQRIWLILISIVILAVVLTAIHKTPAHSRSVFLKLGGAFVASGAVGNLADRIFNGFVIDFIEVRFIDFPVFNIADIAVCAGAAMLIIHFLFFDEKNIESAEEK